MSLALHTDRTTSPQFTILLLFVLAMLFIAAYQVKVFYDVEYRIDEAWRVHSAIGGSFTEVIRFNATNEVNPPGYRILARPWLMAFGSTENLTRFGNILILSLSMGFLFRFAKDLFDDATALLAVAFVGFLPPFFFYTHDAGTYPVYVFATVALWFFFFRWLTTKQFSYAFLYVITGIIGIYTQYFTAFVVFSHGFILLLICRFRWQVILFGLWICFAIGLAFAAGWGLVIAYWVVTADGGVILPYAWQTRWTFDGMMSLINILQLPLMSAFAIIAAFVPARKIPTHTNNWSQLFRISPRWRQHLIFVPTLLTLLVILILNQASPLVTQRNLLLIYPVIALLMAFAVRQFPWPIWVAVIVFMIWSSASHPMFRRIPVRLGAEQVREVIAASDKAGSVFVIESDSDTTSDNVPFSYRLQYRLNERKYPDDLLIVADQSRPRVPDLTYPEYPRVVFDNVQGEYQTVFKDHITGTPQVWHITLNNADYNLWFEGEYRKNYYLHQRSTTNTGHQIDEYLPLPDTLSPIFRFANALIFEGWQLQSTAYNACDTMTFESWWAADDTLPETYSLSVSLVDANGMPIASSNSGLSPIMTVQWNTEEHYYDKRDITIPCDVSAGDYSLVMIVTESDSGNTLPVSLPDSTPASEVVYITTVTAE